MVLTIFISENPPIGNMRSTRRRSDPNELRERYLSAKSSGRMSANILEPSSGGIGKRLKIAKERLTLIIIEKISAKIEAMPVASGPPRSL